MRNILFSSRETDRNIIFSFIALVFFAIMAFVPLVLFYDPLGFASSVLSVAFVIFAWGVFKIVEPVIYDSKWATAKALGIPAVWLVLFLSFAILFSHAFSQITAAREESLAILSRPSL